LQIRNAIYKVANEVLDNTNTKEKKKRVLNIWYWNLCREEKNIQQISAENRERYKRANRIVKEKVKEGKNKI